LGQIGENRLAPPSFITPGIPLDNSVTLTFDLLTSASVYSDVLPRTIILCLLTLVVIAQAIFLVERRGTDRQTDTQSQTNRLPYPTSWLPPTLLDPEYNSAHRWVGFRIQTCFLIEFRSERGLVGINNYVANRFICSMVVLATETHLQQPTDPWL